MLKESATKERKLRREDLQSDLVIIGGGLAGVCTAITAARAGIKVVLVQDRPVLGGNASSEVRLWVLGATSHMGNNNRWAREGGVVDEILVENTYKNPEGNAIIFDSILLDKVVSEKNITLLLNTAVYGVNKLSDEKIESIEAFCSQNQIHYVVTAPLFCDASGDGIVAFLAGAAFRMGAESKEEFGEKFAPSKEYGELLGHSLYFYTKDTGKPVKFTPPSYALDDITKIPRYRNFNAKEHGCKLWWIEYGGRLDTIHDTENIKWELWKVVYGVWNYIKNSGNFPEAETMTLEWMGTIPGKRESRRFEGDYIMTQQDIVEQRTHYDAVAFGGWSIDLHPADGVFSEKSGCNQWHSKGIYQIPYRSLYSKNIDNLFLSGRIISVSHVAFGSTRVMATSGYVGQSVALAAKLCIEKNLLPRDLSSPNLIPILQKELLKTGQHIPLLSLNDDEDLVQKAQISSSSELALNELYDNGEQIQKLEYSVAQMVPFENGKLPEIIFHAHAEKETILNVELRLSSKENNYTPDVTVETFQLPVQKGRNCLKIVPQFVKEKSGYVFVTFMKNEDVQLHYSNKRITGILSVFNHINLAVSNYGKQIVTEDIGVDEFEFWCPKRRPAGQNVAIKLGTPVQAFKASNISNGIDRPTDTVNAWVADFADKNPSLQLKWDSVQSIRKIDLFFDADYDHPMESVLMTHPETVMPFVVRNYVVKDTNGKVIYSKQNNYQTINTIEFPEAIKTDKLVVEVEHPSEDTPAAIFAVRCYH